ncbi:hypothetical protein [Fibrobacter sp.]
MKLNSKIFVLAVFALVAVVESHAAGVFAYGCAETADEYGQDGMGPIECYLGQYPDAATAMAQGFSEGFIFSTWPKLVESMNSELGWNYPSNASDLQISLVTDLDMGGFVVADGDTTCANEFVSIDFASFQKVLSVFDGGSHVIRNFCQIESGNDAGFFANLPGKVIDLTFDSAYVKTTGNDAFAAVLSGRANEALFENVSVTNSVVNASGTAGGLVGDYEIGFGNISSVHVDAVLNGRRVGGLFGEAVFSSAEIGSSVSNVSVDIEVFAAGGDSVIAGGLAGQLTVRDAEFMFDNNNVTLVMPNGADSVLAGGLVGNFFYDAGRSVELRNQNNTIDFFVNSTGYNTYAGGLFGTGSFENVSITDSLNRIHAVIATKGSGDGVVAAGGEFGMIQRASGLRVAHDNVDARLVAAGAEAQFFGGVAGAVAATKTLAVAQSDVKASIASSGEGEINVAMGGLFGSVVGPNANQGGTMEVVCDADTVTVSMQAASTGVVYAGGLVGVANGGERVGGGFYSYMSTVKAPEGSNLITVSSSTVKNLFVGGLAGQVTSPRDLIKFYRARVVGDIDVSAATIADSGAVGGLFGEFNSYRVFIFDNLSEGDILAGADNVGFAVGKVLSRQNDADGVMLTSNVHIGTKDVNVKQVLGTMILGEETVTDWDEGESYAADFHYSITHNYRNAIASENTPLVSTGVLDIDGSGFVNAKDARLLNGVLDESTMKSRLLAYVLTQKENRASGGETNVEDDYTCWENDNGEFVHVCGEGENRTAYKVQLDVTELYSKFTDADKESLEGILDSVYAPEDDYTEYRLVTYTEKNRRVGEDFLKRVRALSADFGVLEYGADVAPDVDLETTVFDNNAEFFTEENSEFYVVYEVEIYEEGEPTGTYASLDETLLYPVYLWPKVTKVHRYNERAAIPPVYVRVDYSKQEYYVDQYRVYCREGEECDPSYLSGDAYGVASFAATLEEIGRNYHSGYSDTIHLVYAQMSQGYERAPIMTVGSDASHSVKLISYAYKDGKQAVYDTVYVGSSSLSNLEIASKYSVAPMAGFKLKKWKADFWAYTTGSGFDREDCYDTTMTSEDCARAVTFDASKDYLAGYGEILNTLKESIGPEANLRWSREFAADGMLDMDSLTAAVAGMGMPYGDYSYSYHMHLTPVLELIPYTVTFNVNADDIPVFISGYTDTLVVYSMDSLESSHFPSLYSTEACFYGWNTAKDGTGQGGIELNEYLLDAVTPVDGMFSLYGIWNVNSESGAGSPDAGGNNCYTRTQEISLQYRGDNGPEGGKVYLWQKLVNPVDTLTFRHDFKESVLEVPDEGAAFRFHVGAEPAPGYVLTRAQFVTRAAESGMEDSLDIDVLHGNDTFVFFQDKVEERLEYFLVPYFERFVPVTFDLNTDRKGVFYDLDFVEGDTLKILNNSDQVELPAWIYTADACVLGWSAEKNAKTHTYRVMVEAGELYEKLQDTQKLYAVWGDAEQCVAGGEQDAGYVRVSAVAENGRIELLEGEDDPRLHKFGTDGTIILPPEQFTGGFRVRVVPDDGYELDRIELAQDGRVEPVENGEWVFFYTDGAEIRAYFVESGEPRRVAGPVFQTSGNAVRFAFSEDGFVQGDSAQIRIVLKKDGGATLVDSVFSCRQENCLMEWVKFPLSSGSYRFTAFIFNGLETAEFKREFEVVSAIEVAGEKSWQMISLANVDMDKLSWDGDETFYWWAEDRNYGKYWQYQELVKSQTPEKERGYWYSSIEGRPLVLKDSAFADDITWNLTNENGGWNLVANPYGWQIELGVDEYDLDEPEEESEDNRKKRVPLVEYSRWNPEEGQYVPVSKLGPYQAVWAQLNRSMSTTIEIAARPSFDEDTNVDANAEMDRTLNRRFAKIGDAAGWALQAMLSDGRGKKDSWNVLGVGNFARQSEEPPAGMGDHVNLSILDGGKRLMKSVKAAGEGASYEWNIDLTATSPRTGYLSFAGIDGLESRGLSVYVTVDGNTTRVREGEPLKVALSSGAKVATVFVGSAPKVALVKTLAGLKAVQAGATLQVDFDAGAGLAGSAVRVDLVDLRGNVVRSAGARAIGGSNSVSLETPKPGIYMLRVRAGNAVSAGKVFVR